MLHALLRLLRALRLLSRRARPPPPTVLLVLGGNRERELAAARAILEIESLLAVVVSSGAAERREIFDALESASAESGVPRVPLSAVLTDARAVCTVTNCTTLADDLELCGVSSVVVATARCHCARAAACAALILGSRGIALANIVPVDAAGDVSAPESRLRVVRDVVRSLLWVLTGFDLSGLSWVVHPARAKARAATSSLLLELSHALRTPWRPATKERDRET